MTITNIENLSYNEAKNLALETMIIKDHEIFFVDCKGHFGYSVLVFKNKKHIYYANDYELHWNWFVKENGRNALRQRYIEKLNNILFTDEELLEEIKTYAEYNIKQYFLRNYWIMRYDYVSCFAISKEDREAVNKAKRKLPYFNPISFCYVKDESIIKEQEKYHKHLQESFTRLKNNLDTFKEMISYELSNHEACITCSYEETLSSLGLRFENLSQEKQKIVLQELNNQVENYYN